MGDVPISAVLFGAFVAVALALMIRSKLRAGSTLVSETELARAESLHRVTRDQPGTGWTETGSKTETRGLSVRFDHDDDPQAEATMRIAQEVRRDLLANSLTVELPARPTTFHVHTSGYVFRIRLMGTDPLVGARTKIQMLVDGDGNPYGGRMENDDDDRPPAVGGWIEVEWAEILKLPS